MTIELIIGGNKVDVVKGSVDAELVVGNHETVLERSIINVEITKGEHEILLLEPEVGIEDLDVNINLTTPQVNITQTDTDLEIVRDGVEVELIKAEDIVNILQGYNELEIVAQSSIIHINPDALPEEAFCSAAEVVGDCVYIYDNKFTNKPVVRKCDITDKTKMPCVALITEKITSTECKIKKINEVDLYSGFISGSMIVVGLTGQPVMPSGLPDPVTTPHYVQVIGVSTNPDTVLLHIDMTICERKE